MSECKKEKKGRDFNVVYCDNWINNNLPDKCAKLLICDPPYYKVKGEFDFIWKTFADYLADVEKWAIECKRVLADNGSLFWYGSAKNIAYSQVVLDKYFTLENNITWHVTDRQTNKSVAHLNSFAPVTERILFYSNPENFDFCRTYLRKHRNKKGYTIKQMAEMMGVYTALYGFYEQNNTGSQIPTEEQYFKIKKILDLDLDYCDISRYFNNSKLLNDVMRYSQESHITRKYNHDTVKPMKLTNDLINATTKEGDLIVVPFAGSGTECEVSAINKRPFIGFDLKKENVEMSNERVLKILNKPQLF